MEEVLCILAMLTLHQVVVVWSDVMAASKVTLNQVSRVLFSCSSVAASSLCVSSIAVAEKNFVLPCTILHNICSREQQSRAPQG